MKPSILHLLFAVSLLFCYSTPSFSQDFEVAPVLVSFDANPGESQSRRLTVRNHSNEIQRYLFTLADYIVNEQGARQSVDAGSTDRSLESLLTVNPSFVELNPNETAEVDLNIDVPQGWFKTCWGIVHVEVAREQTAVDADRQMATGILIQPRINVLVSQSSRANQNYSGTVRGLQEVTVPGNPRRSFEATLINTGDKILKAKVFLAIANMNTAEEQLFDPSNITVYPGQERAVTLTLPVMPEPGSYALAFMMDYGRRAAVEGAQILLEVE